MKNNVVNRTDGKEYLAEFIGNTVKVYKLEADGSKTPKASYDHLQVFANHYTFIEYEEKPLLSPSVKSLIKSWAELHKDQKIMYIKFYDYGDYNDACIKTNIFYYSIEMPKGTINFAKIDSDVNYTLESLGL